MVLGAIVVFCGSCDRFLVEVVLVGDRCSLGEGRSLFDGDGVGAIAVLFLRRDRFLIGMVLGAIVVLFLRGDRFLIEMMLGAIVVLFWIGDRWLWSIRDRLECENVDLLFCDVY